MVRWFSPVSTGELCPPTGLNPVHDCWSSDTESQVFSMKMLEKINLTGIGSQGFGGTVTALYVNIETAPTHIAGLPVAVNVGCHVTRHKEIVL